MKVYREAHEFATNNNFPAYLHEGVWYADGEHTKKCRYQPAENDVIYTLEGFEDIVVDDLTISECHYYQLVNTKWAEIEGNREVYDIMECTYNGIHMGERKVTATINVPAPIAFRIGDYIEIQMQDLRRGENKYGGLYTERFYLYTEPTCKKVARANSYGKAFEMNLTFYPRQYELACVQMRDFVQQKANTESIIYTGFDNVTFYGGARELLDRCMACLEQQFVDDDGNPLWTYKLAPSVDEQINTALERYAFSFKGQSVMDAITKLNDTEGINTDFFVNGRTIYVGFKAPYLCSVNQEKDVTNNIHTLTYGKTSDQPVDIDHGGLFNITKSVENKMPITQLFAYGAARNLNRYYCSDRIKSGRFVNKLMLPSFSDDGRTDYIVSEDGVRKYGIRQGSHEFEEIYPSLRYITYADIRGVKYCIKIKTSGLTSDLFDKEVKYDQWGKQVTKYVMDRSNTKSTYPIARVQCYKVVESENKGVNKLVEAAPPEDLAIFIHAQGKTVKVVLYGGATDEEARNKQLQHDLKVPTRDGVNDYIPGACFCVHDNGWADPDGTTHSDTERVRWFTDPFEATNDKESNLHRIEYVDTFWLTDLYVFESYDQEHFSRDGYSAWAYPRYNSNSMYPESLLVNEVVAVEPINIPDTSDNESTRQKHWDIYLRDIGFALDEQSDFGDMVFVFSTPKFSFIDGILAGREFTIDGGDQLNTHTDRVVCAYREDGTINGDFFQIDNSGGASVPYDAFAKGAIWRIRLNRINDDELKDIGIILPNMDYQAQAGSHVVLLDIYMPDIYIHAAEKRLEREARKYLESNDRSGVNYVVEFDKVRIQQIAQYALQMREGVLLRMSDADLNMQSENRIRTILRYERPNAYPVKLYYETIQSQTISESSTKRIEIQDRNASGWLKYFPKIDEIEDLEEGDKRWLLTFPKSSNASKLNRFVFCGRDNIGNRPAILTWDNLEWHGDAIVPSSFQASAYDDGGGNQMWMVHAIIPESERIEFYLSYANGFVEVLVDEDITTGVVQKEKESGVTVYALCYDYIDFKCGRYYTIEMDVATDFAEYNDKKLYLSKVKDGDIDGNVIELVPGIDCVLVEDEPVNGFTHRKYTFLFKNEYDDAVSYYVGVKYVEDGDSDMSSIRMSSVVESDMDNQGRNMVDYVDFIATNVTIKINDNTRNADSRNVDFLPEPIRRVQAQLSERTHATTWATVMSDIKDNEIKGDKNTIALENLVKTARLNYDRILALRGALFDPDGTCTDLFLQTMMLQVGADSMNYQLEKTYTVPDRVNPMNNCAVVNENGRSYFRVYAQDNLHHFVYTKGTQGGNWTIPGNFSKELVADDEGNYPTYFICIRCSKDNDNNLSEHAWICDTKQYAVNDDTDTNYWYFNWGILTADSNGNYTLSETRGNAYMYGDNIIAGKISAIANNSYFDLTHGNFVLSEGTDAEAALSYIDGVLTIGKVSEQGITNIINQIGLGKDNLLPVSRDLEIYLSKRNKRKVISYVYGKLSGIECFSLYTEVEDMVIYNEQGQSYLGFGVICTVINHDDLDNEYVVDCDPMVLNSVIRQNGQVVLQIDYDTIIEQCYEQHEVTISNGELKDMKLYIECTFDNSEVISDSVTLRLLDTMVVPGVQKPEIYVPCYTHLTDAMEGSTEIAGGLTMTQLLLLKNEQGDVVAGMSGLTKNNENVLMFGGGTYQKALDQAKGLVKELSELLPILITKNGIGSKIGPFEITAYNEVQVVNGDSKMILSAGDTVMPPYISLQQNGTEKVRISGEQIQKNGIYGKTLTSLYYGSSDGKNIIIDDSYDAGKYKTRYEFDPIDLSISPNNWTVNVLANCFVITLTSEAVSKLSGYFHIYLQDSDGAKITLQLTSFNLSASRSDYGYFIFLIKVPINSLTSIRNKKYTPVIEFSNLRILEYGSVIGKSTVFFNNVRIMNGSGSKITDYKESSIDFSTNGARDIVQVGVNGIQVSHKLGGFVQMLNDDEALYVRMFGLPDNDSVITDDGILYLDRATGNVKAKVINQ